MQVKLSSARRNWNYLLMKSVLLFNCFFPFEFTGGNPFTTSSLKEHGDHELCSDPLDSVSYLHRLEKRSYLPPVTCTKNHEMSVVRSKVHCQPRPRLVRLPWPNDTSVHKVNNQISNMIRSLALRENVQKYLSNVAICWLTIGKCRHRHKHLSCIAQTSAHWLSI